MPKPNLVPAIKRGFEIINLLADAQAGLTISQIHRALHLPVSSAATILYTLSSLGYVERNGNRSEYRLTMKLLSFSRRADHLDLVERCHQILARLANDSGFTGHLAILRGPDSMYVDRVAGPGLIQISSYIGMTWPAYSSGVGKAILAFLQPEELRERLATYKFKKMTPKTLTARIAIEKQLSKFRSLGYAWELDEGEIGVGCIAAPVFGPDSIVVAAVSITGTTQQIAKMKIRPLGKMVAKHAAEMSSRLSGK